MKPGSFSFFLLLLPYIVLAQFTPFEKLKFNEIQFKGNVKEVEIIQIFFEIKNGQVASTGQRINSKGWFDTSGYIYKWVMYADDGSVFYTVKTTKLRSDRSRLIDSTFDSNGDFDGQEIITYNNTSKEYSRKYYSRGGVLSNMYIAKFDYKNREIEVRSGIPNKASFAVSKNSYASDGLSMTQNQYDVNSKITGVTQSTYQKDGKLSKTKFTASGEKVSYLVDYEYNQFGFEGKVFRRKSDNSFKLTWDYSYSYDSAGNYIERTASKNGTPASIEKLKIVYY